ncbi:cytidylyltransferase domain-containing protein [Fluviispira sanaruensis]|uniref:Acylneuraminate cytidylyltransferase family protein n=1 Tax=Fluviispira sanaruensis TaxID=2493639 RepID=A0A4P2VPD2_FLUSA|nr:acylneuraminate cytidylyltransferase family protein [Fluviispira sanaruensis]BBH54094.1 acylneuraminate cytidylyltransferase family protein [Fluviispira sanaruensis]
MRIYAIIPARGGSKGVPKKNIKTLAGIPLIAYSIAAAKLCTHIEKIIISTDCEEIAFIAKKYGVEVPFLRPKEISLDSSTDLEFMLHAIHWLNKQKIEIPDYWMHLRVTTPIREIGVLNSSIDMFINNAQATSLRSAHEAPETPFKWFIKDQTNNYFEPLAGHSNYLNVPRQLVQKVYVPNGYVDILNTAILLENNSMHGNKILAFETPFCTEIDTINDFEFLEFQIQNKNLEILKFLKENN